MRLTLAQKGALVLVAMTFVWGTTFPTMKYLHGSMHALQIMAVRFGIAALVLAPLWWTMRKQEWRWGALLGALMCLAFYLQIEGLAYTSSNRNAFITGLNVLLVPIFGMVLGKGLVRWNLWLSCLIAAAGMALLFYEDAPWNKGDTLTLISAVCYALYILLLERVAHSGGHVENADNARNADGAVSNILRPAHLATVQTAVVTALCMVGLFVRDGGLQPTVQVLQATDFTGWLVLLYLALIASVFAVVMQAWGQQYVGAVHSAIIYGLEPVFAALAAWVVLGEVLTGWALVGAVLIVAALVYSQIAGGDE